MVSGGRDSVCLLDLAVRICGAGAVRVLHVNYALRAGAALDERHCADTCARLGVELAVERPPGPERSVNLQAWAREVRYAAARRHAGGSDIAVGHTADDQLETVLMRLLSSPSRRAVTGMRARAGDLVRPLLGFTRAESTGYCRERRLTFGNDETNATPKYVRNRIRHELIPLLEELHPGSRANVLELARVLAQEGELLDAQIADVLAGRRAIPLGEMRSWPRGLARLAVQDLADGVLHAPAAGVARRVEDILGMGDNARLDLPGGVRAVTEDAVLSFERTPPLPR